MVMKEYPTLPICLELDPRFLMQFSAILKTPKDMSTKKTLTVLTGIWTQVVDFILRTVNR